MIKFKTYLLWFDYLIGIFILKNVKYIQEYIAKL